MGNDVLNRVNTRKLLVGLVFISLVVHVLSLYLGRTIFYGWRLIHLPFHSVLESTGAIIAIVVAFILSVLERRGRGTSYNYCIAGALVGMGILDGFHAMVTTGKTFVWLHSLATFTGGTLFALVWLPPDFFNRFKPPWPVWAGIFVTLLGGLSVLYSGLLPPMIDANNFTVQSKVLNFTGGVLLFLASVRLLVSFRTSNRVSDLLFSVHCLLFGAAAVMFEQSELWNVPWWGWHVLRLMAYGAALVFAVETFLQDQRTLIARREGLEREVRKRTVELQNALEEKEILLREVHHRVKNNLQVISSMLSLQLGDYENERIQENYQEILGRINSMALVHDLLHQSEDLTRLDFEEYALTLVDELQTTLETGRTRVTVETEFQAAELDVDTALRCGLILHELISNCLQHAFVGRSTGTLKLRFKRIDGGYELVVQDDGVGFEPNRSSQATESIGLDLVEAIAGTDLGGDCEIETNGGTRVTVRFPAEDTFVDISP